MQTTDIRPILIDIPMPIVTPRLILRPAMPGDGAAIHANKVETWDQLSRWMPWAKTMGTADDDEATVREAYAKFIRRDDLMMVGISRETGRIVMGTGLHRFCWTVRAFEIGYWVTKSAQGHGYATESANALLRYAFGALKARRVDIAHATGNEASRRVIEKLGFLPEALRKMNTVLPDGTVTDHHDYVRFNTDGLPDLDVRWETET